MSDLNSDRESIKEGIKLSIESKMSFITHLVVFLLVNKFILNSDLEIHGITDISMVTVIWGIGLIMHFLRTFIFNNEFIEKRVDEKLKKK